MKYKIAAVALTSLFLMGCAQNDSKPIKEVLNQTTQENLTPDKVISLLKEGNQRFMSGNTINRDTSKLVQDAVTGQHPKAIVLSCVDSRVPTEELFDLSIGDIFVARVAGNFENTDILGSMEFATKISGAKIVLVLGHEYCGAVNAAIDGAELGNITPMLENIKPAIASFDDYLGEKTSKNKEFADKVIKQNILQTIADIRKDSPVMAQMEKEGEIKIVGANYSLHTGKVTFLD